VKAGLSVAGSSDSPVVPENSLVGMYAAVTRKAQSGQSFLPEERISAEQALAMYTTSAAFAEFEEKDKGSLSPGKLADIVVLSGNPLKVAPEQVKDIRVEMTVVGGEIVWESKVKSQK
jgi:predicted amidohydrolase YtcJ